MAMAHLKERKSYTEVAMALRVTRHAVLRWVQRFICGGAARLAGMQHDWSTQRLPKAQEEAFHQAGEQFQRERGEDIRQLLAQQFAVKYRLNSVYDLLKRLDIVWISARGKSTNRFGGTRGIQKKLRPASPGRSAARHSI